ncbi:T cell receptor beta chain VDJC, partial [Arapaima gigas]
MYWYRQRPGENMQLIVFTSVGLEPQFGNVDKTKYEVVKEEAAHGSLTVK